MFYWVVVNIIYMALQILLASILMFLIVARGLVCKLNRFARPTLATIAALAPMADIATLLQLKPFCSPVRFAYYSVENNLPQTVK